MSGKKAGSLASVAFDAKKNCQHRKGAKKKTATYIRSDPVIQAVNILSNQTRSRVTAI